MVHQCPNLKNPNGTLEAPIQTSLVFLSADPQLESYYVFPATRNPFDGLLEAKRAAGKCGSFSLGVYRASNKLDVGWLCSDWFVSKHEKFETARKDMGKQKRSVWSQPLLPISKSLSCCRLPKWSIAS